MERSQIMGYILDSFPYPIVFVDCNHSIQYLNYAAKEFYYHKRGYGNLEGKSLFDCHNDLSREKIEIAIEKLKNHSDEIYIGVNVRNQRYYLNPVRDENGELLGYFERFEMNLQK